LNYKDNLNNIITSVQVAVYKVTKHHITSHEEDGPKGLYIREITLK